ncbi:tropomyosin-2-like [Xenia sp. Carnegie-2017]|uniref:tropomyosin-2-like n=1 Tax=Xenia sp. Carnegie-2017 TaxID=2897299 RepID=UPI001F038117|nr:tropomyosin-2-like [Xenia sp. Carnegie-2017]
MEKIKARINKLKEDIEQCEQDELNARALLVEAKQRQEAAENEKTSFERRIKMLTEELAKTKERLADKEKQLGSLETKTAEHEVAVKNLESQEVEDDEMLLSLSNEVKRWELDYATYDEQWREAKCKEAVLQKDLKKAESRYEDSSERIKQFLKVINSTSEEIKDLEAREYDQTEREKVNEEKLLFLTNHLKETLVREDAAERDALRLDRIKNCLEDEMKNCKNKIEGIRIQMEDVNNIAEYID